jgi:hypothetical protein
MSFTINESPRLPGDPSHAQQTVAKISDKNDRFSAPIMREKVKPALFESPFRDLNDDLMPLILNHAGQGVFSLGQTCKYWNLTLRNFLNGNLNGKRIRREKMKSSFMNYTASRYLTKYASHIVIGVLFRRYLCRTTIRP